MNVNFKVSFYLQGRKNKDGRTTILYRIYLGSERMAMGSTGFSLLNSQWSSRSGRAVGSSADIRHINSQLDTIESDLRTIFRRMEFSDTLSLERIRSEYLRRDEVESQETFMPYFDAYIEKRAEEVGNGLSEASLQKYKVTRRRFSEYLAAKHRRKDVNFSELDYPLLSGFEHYLKTNNRMVNNTAMRMLKTLKTVVLEARREGLIAIDPYLNIRMHMDPVDRGFLTDDEIQRMLSHDFQIKRLEQVRDFFIFSCFTGLAYVDLAKLTHDDIIEMNGRKWIIARRQKTNVSCNVPLLDIPLRIIEKYKGQTKDNHVLPVISNQKSNAFLKEIAAVCGIEKNLTCHLARHTFATMTLSKDVSIESVSKMMGHTNIRTTQLYARITNKKVESDMEKLAMQLQGFDSKMANMGEKAEAPVAVQYNEPPAESALAESKELSSTAAPAPAEPDAPAPQPAKKRGRPRKVQPAEDSAPKGAATTTAYIDGKLVAIKEPTATESKKRQRITRSVKVDIPAARTARR